MSGFTKLSSDIVDSSIWAEDGDTCKVWVTLLALSNKDGYVRGSIGWLASKARVSEDCCRAAVVKFCNPDKASRTPSNEGRRLELLEDGFLILNYMAFRNRLSDDPETTASRLRMRKHREINCATERNVTDSYVTNRNKRNTASASVSESVQKGEVPEGKGYHKDARTVLHFLNETVGRHFRETDSNLGFISARLSEADVCYDGICLMIRRQHEKWKDTSMEDFLRPETLFNKTKFDGYYAAREMPINGDMPTGFKHVKTLSEKELDSIR